MTTFQHPIDSIERFAEVSATLDDPFAERDEVLRAAGLDAAGWAETERRWSQRLREDTADPKGTLVARFSKVYTATRQELSSANKAASGVPDTDRDGEGPVSYHGHEWRAEAARVGLDAGDTPPPLLGAPAPPPPPVTAIRAPATLETLPSAGALPVPALPFQPHKAPIDARPDATLELGARLPLPVMPFDPKRPGR